ncbi:PREDICTED: tetratricopeptide repeat protein 31 isoform X2 [Calidris pugnax]|uniref:tetratricopeptide repeat protein 31 isoform X2 n=1 Tax=Calidris pugnax TaxID=198806 RepID=UPI00071D8665|nr:PREDICTED: tetratricopeptide repeat protein 31 isoform X2 [Calidris pugnax]
MAQSRLRSPQRLSVPGTACSAPPRPCAASSRYVWSLGWRGLGPGALREAVPPLRLPVPPLQLPVPPQAPFRLVKRSTIGEASGAQDTFGHGPDFWYYPSQLEESNEEEEEEVEDYEKEEEWIGFNQQWDVSSEDSEPPYNFCGFKKSFLCEEPLPTRPLPSALEVKMHRLPAPWKHQLTAEEAERNAQELVAEEERMKKKAEKKKLKKKKQKDRKKREKLGQELKSKQEAESSTSSLSSTVGTGHPQNSNAEEQEGLLDSSPSPCLGDGTASLGEEEGGQETGGEEMEDELDLSCTFVFKARQKAGVRLPAPGKEKPAKMNDAELGKRVPEKVSSSPQDPGEGPACPAAPKLLLPCLPALQVPEPEPVALDTSVVEQSLILAGHGNEAAQKGRYAEAVQAFTEAVKLNPREHRLFGNRSYCYEKLQRYEEALKDAEMSLGLQPGWPKGFFRKGKALRGLKRYAEAARTFEELLRLDGTNAEASAQLEACRALLRQTSPRGQSSPGGLPVSPSLLEAGEPPLPASEAWASGNCWDTDTSGFVTVVSSRSQTRAQGRATGSSQQTLPPTHPARDCYPLWVGNITSRISRKVLHSSFSPFGEIHSIRMLPERRCAFINYTKKVAAEAAYIAKQDTEVEGSRLVLQLKHPSHATPPPRWHSEPRGKVGTLPGGLL